MSRAVLFVLGALSIRASLIAEPIAILLDFKADPQPTVAAGMTAEVRAVLESAHLNLRFLRLTDADSLNTFRRIVVVRFVGVCRSGWPVDPIQLDQPALLDHPALGRADVSEGRVLPYVRIFCNEIRAFIPKGGPTSQETLYGRALGRVVVHELYHVLMSTLEHTRTGLAIATLSVRDLTRETASLDTESLTQLREKWGEQQVAIRRDDERSVDVVGELP